MSSSRAWGLIAVCIVVDLSLAEIPVDMPSLASIDTVKGVLCLDLLSSDINLRFK